MIFLLLLALAGPVCAETGFLAGQAQLAWQDRDKPGQTEQAIQLWKQAAQAEPNRAELWIDLSRALGRAVRHAKTLQERQQWADEALAAAQKAVRITPVSAEAYAVYGEALGQWANAHQGIHSLSRVHQAVEALEKAVALNPQYAYAHMLLAEFYRQSPRFFSIGDKTKALEHARLAVEYGPAYAINHLVLAQAYLDKGMKKEGIAELRKIMSLSPPADAIPETRADQETALAMLGSLGLKPAAETKTSSSREPPQCGQAAGYCSEETK